MSTQTTEIDVFTNVISTLESQRRPIENELKLVEEQVRGMCNSIQFYKPSEIGYRASFNLVEGINKIARITNAKIMSNNTEVIIIRCPPPIQSGNQRVRFAILNALTGDQLDRSSTKVPLVNFVACETGDPAPLGEYMRARQKLTEEFRRYLVDHANKRPGDAEAAKALRNQINRRKNMLGVNLAVLHEQEVKRVSLDVCNGSFQVKKGRSGYINEFGGRPLPPLLVNDPQLILQEEE